MKKRKPQGDHHRELWINKNNLCMNREIHRFRNCTFIVYITENRYHT